MLILSSSKTWARGPGLSNFMILMQIGYFRVGFVPLTYFNSYVLIVARFGASEGQFVRAKASWARVWTGSR